MTQSEITVERVFPFGAWRCSAIVEGQRVHQYFGALGYTKKESLAMFQHNYNLNKENKS